MTIGGSILLIAIGAILKWAVTATVSWIDIQTVGTILFVLGIIGLCLALFFTFWTPAQRARRQDQTQPMRRPPPDGRL
jgi:phosphate/sulfate permease